MTETPKDINEIEREQIAGAREREAKRTAEFLEATDKKFLEFENLVLATGGRGVGGAERRRLVTMMTGRMMEKLEELNARLTDLDSFYRGR